MSVMEMGFVFAVLLTVITDVICKSKSLTTIKEIREAILSLEESARKSDETYNTFYKNHADVSSVIVALIDRIEVLEGNAYRAEDGSIKFK